MVWGSWAQIPKRLHKFVGSRTRISCAFIFFWCFGRTILCDLCKSGKTQNLKKTMGDEERFSLEHDVVAARPRQFEDQRGMSSVWRRRKEYPFPIDTTKSKENVSNSCTQRLTSRNVFRHIEMRSKDQLLRDTHVII